MKNSLTLAGISTDQIKAILTIAQTLQKNYDVLGAEGTQNVRNPRPIHQLALAALPTSERKAVTRTELALRLQAIGYRTGDRSNLSKALSMLVKRGFACYTGVSINCGSARFWLPL